MAVLERTSGGYVKGVDKNGDTFYRDPNGHPTKQQSFAASKGGEATAREYETEKDKSGKFTGKKKRKKKHTPPPEPPNIRVTATCKAETDDTMGFSSHDTVRGDIEISGVFRKGNVPSDGEIETIMRKLSQQASEQMPFMDSCDLNIAKEPTYAEATGWDIGEVSVGFERGKRYSYEVDAEQASITDSRWQ